MKVCAECGQSLNRIPNIGFEAGIECYLKTFKNIDKLTKPEIKILADQFEQDSRTIILWLRDLAQ